MRRSADAPGLVSTAGSLAIGARSLHPADPRAQRVYPTFAPDTARMVLGTALEVLLVAAERDSLDANEAMTIGRCRSPWLYGS